MSREGVPGRHGRQDQVERAHGNTEQVLALLHEQKGAPPEDVDADEVATLHEDLCDKDDFFSLRRYEEGEFPTLASISATCERITEVLKEEVASAGSDHEYVEHIQNQMRFLQGRVQQLEYAVVSYARTVARFYRVKLSRELLDEDDFKERMTQVDQQRRRQHNVLLDTLRSINTLVSELASEGYLDDLHIDYWGPDSNADPTSDLRLFESSQLLDSNRDMIRDWAITADIAKSFQDIDTKLKTKKAE